MSLAAVPDDGVDSWGVVETLPAGWTASSVTESGSLSSDGRAIRWGPFLDGTSRTFAYQATPGSASTGNASFSGIGDFGGIEVAATGGLVSAWSPPATGVATRVLPSVARPGRSLSVTHRIQPDAQVTEYSVEEVLPVGYSVVSAGDGFHNPATRTLRWGPFFDSTAREWTYELSVPTSASGSAVFSGTAMFGTAAVTLGERIGSWSSLRRWVQSPGTCPCSSGRDTPWPSG